eukprot:10261972-Karenia_brevis.AAC.1
MTFDAVYSNASSGLLGKVPSVSDAQCMMDALQENLLNKARDFNYLQAQHRSQLQQLTNKILELSSKLKEQDELFKMK